MHITQLTRIAALSSGLVLLSACTAFRTADNELDAASRKLTTDNVTLTADAGSNVPKAAITPQGDLLIAGKPVALTRQQRQEVSAYRAQHIEIAREGIEIGHAGIEVGRHAVAPMVLAALFGESDDKIQASMNKRLAGVRAATAKLCDRLPQILAAQQQLAADLPAFKPYATMTQKDIDDCREDALNDINVADD
jgi:hypothetical protein